MKGTLLFLGTGASAGVPLITCDCAVCHSPLAVNKRLRSSVLIKTENKKFLIDVGPDFRQQALKHGIRTLDGILFTHTHHDHIAGVDELRVFNYKTGQPIPILLSSHTEQELKKRYDYIFDSSHKLDLHVLPSSAGDIDFLGVNIGYMTYQQGHMNVNGFRFGELAYLSDISHSYHSSIFDSLKGVKRLIISALRYSPSPLHFSVDDAIAFIDRVGAEQAWLTHVSHDLEYEKTNAYLPDHINLAYDDLEIEFGGSHT